jgi:hypothetical protein
MSVHSFLKIKKNRMGCGLHFGYLHRGGKPESQGLQMAE